MSRFYFESKSKCISHDGIILKGTQDMSKPALNVVVNQVRVRQSCIVSDRINPEFEIEVRDPCEAQAMVDRLNKQHEERRHVRA